MNLFSIKDKAFILGLAAVLFWSTAATAFKLTLRYISPAQIIVIATITSFLTLYFLSGILLKNWRIHLSLKNCILGALNPFLYYILLFRGYDILSAQEAVTLNYTWAIVIVLLAVPLLHQKIQFMEIGALIISFSGILIIATKGKPWLLQFDSPQGVIIMLLSSIVWALYWIYNTKSDINPIISLTGNFFFGIIWIFMYLFISPISFNIPIKGLLGSIYIGFFEMGFTFTLWLTALKKASNIAKVSNLIYLSPFFSLLLIQGIIKEKIHITTYLGLILIISGIILQKKTKKHP